MITFYGYEGIHKIGQGTVVPCPLHQSSQQLAELQLLESKKKSAGCLFQGPFNATLGLEILQLGFNCTTRVITFKCF